MVSISLLALGVLGVWLWTSSEGTLVARRPSVLVVDRRGEPIGESPGEGDVLGFWPVPPMLPERIAVATLETEDRHFYTHAGVHWPSVARAMAQNLSALRTVSGASTVAMQVARMQRGRARGLGAKVLESIEAVMLIDDFGHEEVLRQYLTLAPYGNRVHGVVRAARLYFDKPAEDLSWLQAAYLAALPQAPAHMNPYDDAGRARGLRRAHRILRTLHARGLITTRDLEVALASDLALVPRTPRPPEALHAALALIDQARQTSGTVVRRATLDLDMQRRVAALVRENLDHVRARGATNTAAVVVDLQSADILAYVGSADYFDAKAHGAIDFLQVKRSPGSTLKPFIYGLGFDTGKLTAASLVPDTAMDFVNEGGRSYRPGNITKSFLGPMLAREALANSRNIPAMRVLGDVGVEPVLSMLARGGVTGVRFEPGAYGLGLALGNLHTTPLELATLYRALGDGGRVVPLRTFLDDEPAQSTPARLFGDDTAALVLDILSDPEARQPSFPPGSPLDYDYAVATKTGTSQGFRDGWTAAVSDRLVVVVWVGNHDWRRMNTLGGLAGTAEAAHRILDALMPRRAPHRSVAQSFPAPRDGQVRTVCALSGRRHGPDCPHRRTELFRRGTEPETLCDVHVRARIDKRNGLLATAACPAHMVEEQTFLKLDKSSSTWARQTGQKLLPTAESPLCGGGPTHSDEVSVTVVEPRAGVRYTYDPDTPPEFATIRLRADVEPADEDVVFLVDGTPVAKVGWPHETRWTVTPGTHVVQAAFARRAEVSAPVAITVRR